MRGNFFFFKSGNIFFYFDDDDDLLSFLFCSKAWLLCRLPIPLLEVFCLVMRKQGRRKKENNEERIVTKTAAISKQGLCLQIFVSSGLPCGFCVFYICRLVKTHGCWIVTFFRGGEVFWCLFLQPWHNRKARTNKCFGKF